MFTKLKAKRSSWETNWELCAKYTMPQMYLEDSVRESGVEPEDLVIGDSIGYECLNNFISQILKIAFPAQGAFFRVTKKKGNTPNFDLLAKNKHDAIFRSLEDESMTALYRKGLHAQKTMLLGTMLCLGDVVYKIPKAKGEKIQVYDLNDVVIKRRRNGNVTDMIICEEVEFKYLPEDARVILQTKGKRKYSMDDVVKHYTHVCLNDHNKKTVKYSVDDISLDTAENFTPSELCEYQIGSLTLKRGSNYAVGVVQQYLPDIHKANVYADTATDTAVVGSLVNWAIDPKANIRPEEFANREQGQPFGVKPADVQAIQANVGQHLQITQSMYNDIVQKLSRVFLLPNAVQRDAERVTAQEIRMVSQRLEETHNGLKAMIAENLQRPLAHLGLDAIDDEELNKYKGEVEISVVTAMEAQSRSMELDNMMASIGDTTVFNSVPPQVAERMKLPEVLNTIFTSRNTNADTFIKTEEEFQAEQQAMAEREQAQQAQGQPQAPSQSQVFQGDEGLVEDIRKPLI